MAFAVYAVAGSAVRAEDGPGIHALDCGIFRLLSDAKGNQAGNNCYCGGETGDPLQLSQEGQEIRFHGNIVPRFSTVCLNLWECAVWREINHNGDD